MHCEKLIKARSFAALAGILFLISFDVSEAYAVPPVPPSAASEHLQQQFTEPAPVPQEAPPAVTVPNPQPIPPEAAAQSFVLRSVVITDSTIYPAHTFDNLFVRKIGQTITFADALAIARQITTRYRSDGYILSQAIITPRAFEEAKSTGILTIEVVEGFIHHVSIRSDMPQSDRRHLIEGYADKITEQTPLNSKTLERYMLLINDLPGVKARAIIQPSPDTFGAADIVIEVQNKMFEASFTSDNRGNKFLGPWQEQATVTENSVVGIGERTTVRAIRTVPLSEMNYTEIQHEEQLDEEGTRLILLSSIGHTNPGGRLTPLDFEGTSDDISLTLTHPFLRSRAQNFTGRLTFDGRDDNNNALGVRIDNDRVRAFRAGGTYDTSDRFNGVDLFDVSLSQGVNGLDSTSDGLGRTRTVGHQEFTKANFNVSRLQNLPHGFSLLTAATGQYTQDPLLLSEQFTLGGVGFGQAYDYAELSGDSAIAGKVELRYGQPVGEAWFNSYQIYAYCDGGSVFTNDLPAGTFNRASLASAGAGVRMNFTPNVYGYVELAKPLTRNVASENDKDPRLFFSLTIRY